MPTYSAPFKLTKPSQLLVKTYIDSRYQRSRILENQKRFLAVDKAIQMESDLRREKIKNYYDDIEVSMVSGPVRTIANFFGDIFVSNPNIFEMTTKAQDQRAAIPQWNAVIEENSAATNWSREFMQFFKSLPKYNVGALEVSWMQEVTTELDLSSTTDLTTKQVSRQGNKIKNWDMYNTFYDPLVSPAKLCQEGEFIGHTEQYTLVRLHEYISQLKTIAEKEVTNDNVILNPTTGSRRFYRPAVTTSIETNEDDGKQWDTFFGTTTPTTEGGVDPNAAGAYEVTTVYARIIPSMFKIKVPGADNVQIWKFVIVNWDTIIFAEKQTNAHNLLPVAMCQMDEQNIGDDVKSQAEALVPFQNLSTKLHDGRIKAIARAVSDRAVFDKTRISATDIDSDNPKAKIPAKPDIRSNGLSGAYMSIPFNDNTSGTIIQELQLLQQQADRQSGLNNAQRGMFQKGNKTLGEFNEIMTNADDDLRAWARGVESQTMVPIKKMIKTNMLQYQQSGTYSPAGQQEPVTVNSADLRKSLVDFKLADGLITKDAILDTATARAFLDMLMQLPMLQQYYGQNLPALVEYILTSAGFDLSAFGGTTPTAPPAPPAGGSPAPEGAPQ